MKRISIFLVWFLIPSLLAQPVYSQSEKSNFKLMKEIDLSGNEFVTGNFPGAVLMPVNLWGAIGRPGIHHIPVNMDLITLITLAGGPSGDVELDSISIKRRSDGKEEIIIVDAEEILEEVGTVSPLLKPNDLIMINKKKPLINQNLVTVMGFIGSVFGLIMGTAAVVALTQR